MDSKSSEMTRAPINRVTETGTGRARKDGRGTTRSIQNCALLGAVRSERTKPEEGISKWDWERFVKPGMRAVTTTEALIF
jgi:hypothetical protein